MIGIEVGVRVGTPIRGRVGVMVGVMAGPHATILMRAQIGVHVLVIGIPNGVLAL